MRRDLACALTLLGLAGLYYALARDLGQTALSDAVGPAGLPLIYASVLAAVAVLLGAAALLEARRRPRSDAAAPENVEHRKIELGFRLWRAFGTLAIGLVYLAIVSFIGYAFATALAIAAMAIYQGERVSWRLVVVAGVGAAALYVLFDLVLGVPLPAPWNA